MIGLAKVLGHEYKPADNVYTERGVSLYALSVRTPVTAIAVRRLQGFG
jgi:hypothetical protein